MTKLTNALLIVLLFISGSASAEWVKVGETDVSSAYIDLNTVRKDGNLLKVWRLQDLKQRHKDGELSRRFRTEYDCKNERYRILSNSSHSEKMAGGKILFQSAEESTKWIDIPPGSIAETVLQIVC